MKFKHNKHGSVITAVTVIGPRPGASKLQSEASKNRSLVCQWASVIIISLSGPVGLSESVSLVNNDFQTETTCICISKLKTESDTIS